MAQARIHVDLPEDLHAALVAEAKKEELGLIPFLRQVVSILQSNPKAKRANSSPPKPPTSPVVEKIPAEIAAQRQREWDAEALRQQAPRGFAWDKAKTMEEVTAPSLSWQTKEDLEKIAEHHHKWFKDVEE